MKTPLEVVIVEDSEDDTQLLLRKLKRANYEPRWVRIETEEELNRVLDEQAPDIIIADYAMPKFNGLAALSMIRERGLDIPFIMVSGTVGEEFAVEVMRAGAHDYLMKDSLSRLVPAIKRELKEAQVRKRERHAQEALRQSEKRLQLALVGANDGVWDWNLETGEVFYSPRWAEMLGFTIGEIEPTKAFWDRLIHPKDIEQVRQDFDTHLPGNKPGLDCEYRLQSKSGEWKWIQTRGRVVERDATGKPLRAVGTNKDVTEQKKLEEQLRQAQKMESIGLLAGGIAHDFNNLLTVILGHVNLELTNLRKEGNTDIGVYDSLEQIGLAAERAAALTRQLLAFSRKQVMKLEVLEPAKILKNLQPMLQRIIGENIKLKIAHHSRVRNIKADSGLIEQTIMNLAVNARDAMPDGGTLTLELANVEADRENGISAVAEMTSPCVLLRVQDTGIGMDKETLERIFEPFFTTKPPGQGTGLGLATVYGIITQFGGHIEAESEPGRGTTFKVYFPAVDEKSIVASRKREKTTTGGQERVLLCEDEEIVRNLSHLILQRAGYEVILAEDGAQAIAEAQKHKGKIDLLVTDMVMPDISGYKLAERLQQEYSELPVLFVSGYTEEAVGELHTLEDYEFLTKPFRPNELLQRVRYVIDKHKVKQVKNVSL